MSNPTFYTRIQNKYDTKANLDDSTFIPKSGELIGASNAGSGDKYKKLKIGDGTNKYSNLQFVDQEAIDLANAAQDTADSAYALAEGKLSTTGTAAKATADANGNNIINTYATKNEVNEIKQSFQDGCDTIVDGCTTYGSTPSTNSPEDIVKAIENISTNRYNAGVSATKVGTATAANVLTGKTFTNSSGVGLSGTMTNNGAISQSLAINGSYTIPAGYHNGSGKVTQNVTTKAAATYGAKTSAQTIAAGQYLSGAQTIAAVTQSGLSAENIVKGKTVTISSNGSNLWSVTGTLDLNASLLYSSTGNWVTRTYTTTKDYKAIVVFVNATETLNNSYHKASVSGNGLSSLKTLTYNDEGTRQGKTVIYSGKNIPKGTTITMAWCYEGSCSVIGFG